MANILCPTLNPCQPCPDGDPTQPNLSAELPDIDLFFSIVRFKDIPPLGGSWSEAGCTSVCTSSISQEDADLCALRQAQDCIWIAPGGGPGGWRGPGTVGNPNGQQRRVFSNTEQSCTKTCADGSPFTKVVAAGTILSIISQIDADEKAHNLACKQAMATRICLTDIATFACQNTFYDQEILAEAGPDIVGTISSWTVVGGSLPPGLNLVPSDDPFIATVSGTPTDLGVFTFAILFMLSSGDSAQKTYTVTVGGITTSSSLPDAPANTAYSQGLATSGMTPPLTWSLLAGSLPAGLTLDAATGIISGTPTTPGLYAFSIQAQEAAP